MMLLVGDRTFVRCPGCATDLPLVREQDKRVAIVRHRPDQNCKMGNRAYRVDRLTGFAQELKDEEPA